MSIPGDTVTSLSRLSNRRKVKTAGEEDPQSSMLDLAGLGASAGGGSLPLPMDQIPAISPDSIDVRANEIIDPEQEQRDEYYDIGQSLADYVFSQSPAGQANEELKNQAMASENYQTMQPEGEENYQTQDKGFLSNLSNLVSPIKEWASGPPASGVDYYHPEGSQIAQKKLSDLRMAREQGISPEEFQQQEAANFQQQQQIDRQALDEALKNPYTRVVHGATDQVINNPDLQLQLEEAGIPVRPEELELTKMYEIALSDQQNLYEQYGQEVAQQVEQLRQRIDSGEAGDMDKYYIGLALAMPLILGGIFGKEAAIQGFAGATQGLMDIYERREKNIEQQKKKLSDLEKMKMGADVKLQEIKSDKLKIPKDVKEVLGEDPLEHLKSKKLYKFQTADGEKEGAMLKPNLIANIDYLGSKDSLASMEKVAGELSHGKSIVDSVGKDARNIVQIVSQIKNPGNFEKLFSILATNKYAGIKPSSLGYLGEDIMLNGEKVNSAVALAQALESMMEERRQAQNIKSFGPELQSHFENMISNVFTNYVTPDDMANQVLQFYVGTRDKYLDNVKNEGFYPQPMLKEFYGPDKKMYDLLNKSKSKKSTQSDLDKLEVETMEIPG